MKKLATIILLLVTSRAFSQDSLTVYNYMRNQITVNGAEVLGGWSAVNIGVGIGGMANTPNGSSLHYFYQMTTIWNVANMGAAVYGYISARNNQNRLSQQNSMSAQNKAENILLINGGLDLVYTGVGTYFYHQGIAHNSHIKKGYGSAIMLQGVFLLLFDVTNYSYQKHNGKKLMHFVNKNPIAFDGHNLSITINI